MRSHSRARPRELSTVIVVSTRSLSDSAREVRFTATTLRSDVNLPTITGSSPDCSANWGTSRALMTTMSAWPPTNAENGSKGLLASIRML